MPNSPTKSPFLDDEHHPVIPAIDKKHAASENQVQVIRVTGIPQQLAGLGMQHFTGRSQQVQGVLAEHRPSRPVGIAPPG